MSLIITGGIWKGRKLYSSPGKDIRPTAGRVRQALFNVIGMRVREATFLDLFAGTGAVGLEALSRGAKAVCMVEKRIKAFRLLEKNSRNLSSVSCGLQLKCMDAFTFCRAKKKRNERYDIIFSDPPFSQEFNCIWPLIKPLLKESGCGIIQFPTKLFPHWADSADTIKKYGESSLAIFYT
jgi:16S rRNA (guanine966-N2)-methyltransferase